MFIIWGASYYFTSNVVRGFGECPSCRRFAYHKSYDGRKYGHLYFIPLFPVTSPQRVLHECSACQAGSVVEQADLPNLIGAIEGAIDPLLALLDGGLPENRPESSDAAAAPIDTELLTIVDQLLVLGRRETAEQVIDRLKRSGQGYYAALLQARVLHFDGPLPTVEAAYLEALDLAPDPGLTMNLLGRYYVSAGRHAEAIKTYQAIEASDPHEMMATFRLIDLHVHLKEWSNAVDAYERAIDRHPDWLNSKDFARSYQKACKKAGRTARVAP
ncbi:MAG TPA: tetratricopeptide repeat protein [Pirellulaceae bacterium]|nr:tetratricopeptide repeat protein [Pirellulaceae bacterium]